MSTLVPPIKSQGIKTKLVPWIKNHVMNSKYNRWVEPFMGTGVVAFNVQPKSALLCDSNPHIIRFYNALKSGEISAEKVKKHLTLEGDNLLRSDGEHYYTIRERFNLEHDPLDFLFLNRSCFNGMMRFNKKGGFNVPFCRKPNRFAQALVTKICNQVKNTAEIIQSADYTFKNIDFLETLSNVAETDIIYCDPPYIDRHVDYYDSWNLENEINLKLNLNTTGAKYLLSTWLKNKFRTNNHIFELWNDCYINTKEHFYHVGAKETNRNPMIEAVLTNFHVLDSCKINDLGSNIEKIPLIKNSTPKFTQATLLV